MNTLDLDMLALLEKYEYEDPVVSNLHDLTQPNINFVLNREFYLSSSELRKANDRITNQASIENQSQPRKLTLAQFCNGYPPLPVKLVLMSGVFSWPDAS